ncbi:hypothetical protein EDB89DRAFT_1908901 [Lactarius sanguifluus]|nr:hypothetical protein EDB89DRAFT_1908901 [Lactarius sanguifluus]
MRHVPPTSHSDWSCHRHLLLMGALVRSWGVLPRPVNLCGLTRCVSAQDAATPKAHKGPIEKHGTSKEEIKSLNFPPPTQATQYGTSSTYPLRARTMSRESAFSATAASGYADAKQEKCVVYSLGINDKSSFEAALLEPTEPVFEHDAPDRAAADRAARVGQLWQIHDWWAALGAAGLRLFWTESNLVYMNYNAGGKPRLAEYSFMNIRGNIRSFTRQQTEQMRTS